MIVQNFNKTRLIYCSFLTARYRDVLVIKMTFIFKKKNYNAPKNIIRHNSMFSDVILLCVFSLKLYILAVFYKKHLFFQWSFAKLIVKSRSCTDCFSELFIHRRSRVTLNEFLPQRCMFFHSIRKERKHQFRQSHLMVMENQDLLALHTAKSAILILRKKNLKQVKDYFFQAIFYLNVR